MNRQELLQGALHGSVAAVYMGWYVAPVVLICAILWALGGADGYSKAFRRIGVAVAICLPIMLVTGNFLWALAAVAMWGVFSIGYGIPSLNDEGSTLGKLAYIMTDGLRGDVYSERKATWMVRSFLFMLFLTAFSIPMLAN